MITVEDLIGDARTWLGTPYQHQGRTRRGVDCVGLVLRVAQDLGLTDFDIDGYSRVPSNAMMKNLLRSMCEQVPDYGRKPGMILHLAYERQPRHLALMTSSWPDRIIHSSADDRKVVEHLMDQRWVNRIRGCYKIPGVRYD